MKTFNAKMMMLTTASIALLGVGCGKNTMVASTYQPPLVNDTGLIPVSPDGTGTGSGNGSGVSYGDKTVTFTPVSIAEFNSYVSLHPLNDPKNFALTVDLQNAGNGRFGGSVKISYSDTGYNYTGTFEAGLGTNVKLSGLKDSGVMEAEYNRWFILNGKYYFSAYFQDSYGAIVIVFDNYVTQGDAQGTGILSGSVYYKNFAQSYAPQSPYRKCWFLYDGPYTCRSTTVMNKSSAIPGDGFRKLGTFSGLKKAAAFND